MDESVNNREPLHYVTVRPGLFGGSVEPGVYVHAAEVAAILRDTYAYDPYDVDALADELDAIAGDPEARERLVSGRIKRR